MKKIILNVIISIGMLLGSIHVLADSDRISIKVNLSEMKFQIEGMEMNAPLVLKAGQAYRLVLENMGNMKHEVLFGRGVDGENAEEYTENLFSNFKITVSGAIMVSGEKRIWVTEANSLNEIELDAGTRLALYFKLPDNVRGNWEIGCFMPGHFQMGMRLPLIVE